MGNSLELPRTCTYIHPPAVISLLYLGSVPTNFCAASREWAIFGAADGIEDLWSRGLPTCPSGRDKALFDTSIILRHLRRSTSALRTIVPRANPASSLSPSLTKLPPHPVCTSAPPTTHHGRREDPGPPDQASQRVNGVRNHTVGGARVQRRPALHPPDRRAEPHPGPHLVPEQQETAGTRQGLRPPLQHGAGEREGDVDRDAAPGQRQEGKANKQGPFHQQDVFARRLRHFGSSQLDANARAPKVEYN